MINLAVILAAGCGSRMNLSRKPKGFLNIAGKPLIEYSIQALLHMGIGKIIIATGHSSEFYEQLALSYPQISVKKNEDYLNTGSLKSLCCLKPLIHEDFILLESDILYDSHCIKELIDFPYQNAILMAKSTNVKDGVWVEEANNSTLRRMSKDRKVLLNSSEDILVGITKMSLSTYHRLLKLAPHVIAEDAYQHYDFIFEKLIDKFYTLHCKELNFTEIDDNDDLAFALTYVYPKLVLEYGL